MKQTYIEDPSSLSFDQLNSSLSKLSTLSLKRPKYTTLMSNEKPNHQKQIFRLPSTVQKSFSVLQPPATSFTRDILETIKYSLNEIDVLKKTYTNISDERRKYKDIIDWLRFMLVEFRDKHKLQKSNNESLLSISKEQKQMTLHKHISELHIIFSSAIHQLIKELKQQNLEKACLVKVSWQSIINFHNSLTQEFSHELQSQKKQINVKYQSQQLLYQQQISELEDKLEKSLQELAKREKYFYQVVKDNRIMRKRVGKLMDKIQGQIENNSYLKEQNLVFYKENERLKLMLETEMVQQKYRQVLQKLQSIERQFLKNKKRKRQNKDNLTKQFQTKQSQIKNRNIIEKQINEIIKRVNANDFLDLDMATLPSGSQIGILFHGIGIQTQPFVESIGVNTFMNMVKRSVGIQYYGQRKKFTVTQEFQIQLEPMMLQLRSGEIQIHPKKSNDNSNSDRKKGKKHKDSISNSHHRPSEYIDGKAVKENMRHMSTHNNQKKSRVSLMKGILPTIGGNRVEASSQTRFSTIIHPLANLSKANLDFMKSSTGDKKEKDLRKSSFIMKNVSNKLSFIKNKNSEFEEEGGIGEHNQDEINEGGIGIANIQEEEQSDEADELPVIKKVHSSAQNVVEGKGNKKEKDKNKRGSKSKTVKQEFNDIGKLSKQLVDLPRSESHSKLSDSSRINNMFNTQSGYITPGKNRNQQPILTIPGQLNNIDSEQARLVGENNEELKQSKTIFKTSNSNSKSKSKSKKNYINNIYLRSKQKQASLKKSSRKNSNLYNKTFSSIEKQEQSELITRKPFQTSSSLYPLNKNQTKPSLHLSTNTALDSNFSYHNRNGSTSSLMLKDKHSNTQRKSLEHLSEKNRNQSDTFSEGNIIKLFRKVNQQILVHKNNLLKQEISFEEFFEMNMVRHYGLKNITLQIKQRLKNTLNKYKGNDLMMQVFKKLVQNQQINPLSLSLHYKRHIFRVYTLILQFWDTYSNLQNFQSLCQSFMKDLISSFFNNNKTDKIVTFFEMIEVDNEYKMFSIMENVISTESQSLAFMNTVYNLQSVFMDKSSISIKELVELVGVVEMDKLELWTKVNKIFKYAPSKIQNVLNINSSSNPKSKALPFFNLILQLNKNSESSIIDIEATIQTLYNQAYYNKYPIEYQLQDQLNLLEKQIPESRYLKTLQSMQTETLRQSQRLLYQLVKLEFRNKIMRNCWEEVMGEDLLIIDEVIVQALTSAQSVAV